MELKINKFNDISQLNISIIFLSHCLISFLFKSMNDILNQIV